MAARNDLDTVIENWEPLGDTVYAESTKDPRSPLEELRNDGSRAIRTIFVPWDERETAAWTILAYPTILANGQTKYISRSVPLPYLGYTNSLNNPFLYATQIMRTDPVGMPEDENGVISQNPGDGLPAEWLLAKMQVLYESLTYDIFADEQIPDQPYAGVPDEASLVRYVTPTVMPAGDAIPLPSINGQNSFKYVDGAGTPTIIPGTPSVTRAYFDWILIWHMVPAEAIGSVLVNPFGTTFTVNCATTAGSNVVTPSARISSIFTSMLVTSVPGSTAIPGGTYVSGNDLTTIFLTQNAVSTNAAVPLTFTNLNIDACLGRVNSEEFPQFGTVKCPPGTLLFTAFTPRRIRSALGDRLYDCEFRFKYFNFGVDSVAQHNIGHNHLLKVDGKYYEVNTLGGSTSNYPYIYPSTSGGITNLSIYTGMDFNMMFRPA